MKRSIVLSYTVQKIVTVNINDFELTPDEIEDKIDELFREHCPEDFDVIDSDYDYYDDSEQPKPLGCEPLPPDDCWVDIFGDKWATNGWCIVSPECPSLNDGNAFQPWCKAKDLGKLGKFFQKNRRSNRSHQGYFDKRFASIKEIGCKVYGTTSVSPGWCVLDDKLIAVIMPVEKSVENDDCSLIQFNSVVCN